MLRPAVIVLTVFTLVNATYAEHNETEELLVTGSRATRQIEVADTVEISPDSAALLRKAPGANVNGNGPLTGIAQYRGMYGSRISVVVDGAVIGAGGPNWMDPPLSYAPAALLESLVVYRGIAPVGAGQETIGGAINATTWSGDFASGESVESSGRLQAGGQPVSDAWLVSAAASAATHNHRLKIAGLREQAGDAEFNGGEILPTEYERARYDLGYAYRRGGQTLQLDFARNETGDSGTPALPMDIQYIDSDLASLNYNFEAAFWALEVKLYYSEIDHGMSNYHLRQPPAMAGMWRRNIAKGENLGFKLNGARKDSSGSWSVGIDGHGEQHSSDIDNPNSPAFFVVNFNNATRDLLGVFAERQQRFNHKLLGEFGLRYNRVVMDADAIDGTPARMMAAPGQSLRDTFNGAERNQSDNNIDWVAKAYYQASDTLSYYAGVARKSRSPSYQERYLWLPLEATAGLADGRTYTGNINLDPEVAHEIELGLDYQAARLTMSPRFFYRDVEDYIQGVESTNTNAVMLVSMMNTANGSNNAPPLEFHNVDANLYGFDMDWAYQLNDQWSLSGIVNYVRGERDDIDDNLYRIAPLNNTLAVNYRAERWQATLESVAYVKQDNVSATNSEQETPGYGVLNARGYWQVSSGARLSFGVENLLDKKYRDHLAGYNRVRGNDDIALGERLPAYGRNLFARVDYEW